jgi:hypothetical protein
MMIAMKFSNENSRTVKIRTSGRSVANPSRWSLIKTAIDRKQATIERKILSRPCAIAGDHADQIDALAIGAAPQPLLLIPLRSEPATGD